jgi:hypothetical protein
VRVGELPNGSELRPYKPAAADVPHVTIEPNTHCDLRCRLCYATGPAVVKDFDAVCAEIDYALSKRRLDAVSLVGGEPTLHPRLVDLVRHIVGKGLNCILVSNGRRFLREGGEALLDELAAAGLDRVMLHVDTGQERDAPTDELRHRLLRMMEARGLTSGLAITLYVGEERDLPGILREFAAYEHFDGVLVTLAMEPDHFLEGGWSSAAEPDLRQVVRSLEVQLGVLPAAYLPTTLDDAEVSWLMYFYYLDAASGACFGLSPRFNRAFRWLYRRLRGHEFFADTLDPMWRSISMAVTGALEVLLSPSRLPELVRFLWRIRRGRLRFQYVLLQRAPRMNPEHGRVQFCWQCPDATVRNGRLVPVCMAAGLSPLGGGAPTLSPEVARAVHAHLEGGRS